MKHSSACPHLTLDGEISTPVASYGMAILRRITLKVSFSMRWNVRVTVQSFAPSQVWRLCPSCTAHNGADATPSDDD